MQSTRTQVGFGVGRMGSCGRLTVTPRPELDVVLDDDED